MICIWVDVVEELHHARRLDSFHHLHAKPGAVALVIRLVNLAVEQFDADRQLVLFGRFLDAVEADHAVLDRIVIGDSFAIAEKAMMFGTCLLRPRHRIDDAVDDLIMVRGIVQTIGNAARTRVPGHRTMQAMVGENAPVFFVHQVDGGETHLCHRLAELGKRYLLIAPSADRLLEAACLNDGFGLRRGSGCERGSRKRGSCGCHGVSSSHLGHLDRLPIQAKMKSAISTHNRASTGRRERKAMQWERVGVNAESQTFGGVAAICNRGVRPSTRAELAHERGRFGFIVAQ